MKITITARYDRPCDSCSAGCGRFRPVSCEWGHLATQTPLASATTCLGLQLVPIIKIDRLALRRARRSRLGALRIEVELDIVPEIPEHCWVEVGIEHG